MTFLRGHWQVLLLGALVAALWQTPVVYPLKLLIVFLHELSHMIAVLATGGSVETLTINPQQGGMVTARGGSRFITLSAGYLGSLALGLILFFIALRSRADRIATAALGAVTLLATAFYIRDGFALGFGLVTGAGLLLMARYLGHGVNDMVLRVIGLASMIYVPWDIFDDTLHRAHLPSDAWMLADEIGGTTMMWGGLWLVISLTTIALGLRYGLGTNSNLALRPRQRPDQNT